MSKVTADQVREQLEEIVTGREDFKYIPPGGGDCAYSYEGEPSCLIGHLFHRYYPELFEQVKDSASNSGTSVNDVDNILEVFTWDAVDYMVDVQCAQDDGHRWGTVI